MCNSYPESTVKEKFQIKEKVNLFLILLMGFWLIETIMKKDYKYNKKDYKYNV